MEYGTAKIWKASHKPRKVSNSPILIQMIVTGTIRRMKGKIRVPTIM
jgi:hypothetical protein